MYVCAYIHRTYFKKGLKFNSNRYPSSGSCSPVIVKLKILFHKARGAPRQVLRHFLRQLHVHYVLFLSFELTIKFVVCVCVCLSLAPYMNANGVMCVACL